MRVRLVIDEAHLRPVHDEPDAVNAASQRAAPPDIEEDSSDGWRSAFRSYLEDPE